MRVRRLLRGIGLWVGGLFAALAVAAIGLYAWMHTSLPAVDGEVAVAGLSAPVEILRDPDGVPHIFAATDEDAAFALGFVHAQDRLWQMETMRRLGSGRLSEVVGDLGVETDQFMLTLGLYHRAEEQFALLSPELRALITAYTAGVNAWLDQRSGALPPEFVLLFHAPEPWRPADSLVWGKLMAWRLATNRHEELLRHGLDGQLSPEQVAALFEQGEDDHGPITGSGARDTARLDLSPLLGIDPLSPREAGGASNFWVVDGSRTTTGKPILANDPHLPFMVPGTWYLARLVTPERTISGASAPGVPFIVLGHNDRVAWGFTTTHVDTEDLIVERLSPIDPGRYETPQGTAPFTVRSEVIDVRFGPTLTLDVRESRHGPIISDAVPEWLPVAADTRADHAVALAATYLRDDDRTPEAVFGFNRAAGWADFRAALEQFHSPQQNVAYADADGRIAFLSAGRIPIRPDGGGRRPVPGWTGAYDWQGFIPTDALPQAVDPVSGRLVNANNRVDPPGYPYDLGGSYDPGFRAERIVALIDGRPLHDLDSLHAIQLDAVSLAARGLAEAMIAGLPPDAPHAAIAARLDGWDGTMARDRPEPLIYAAWKSALFDAIVADELTGAVAQISDDRPRFLLRVLTGGEAASWCDDVGTAAAETCSGQISLALGRAVAVLSDRHGPDVATWRWGDAHAARFSHLPLGRIPGVAALTDRSIASDGGRHTANRAVWRGRGEDPFASVHGPGLRAVYDLSDLSRSRFMISIGQSGNPLSRHYGNLIERWRDGAWIELGRDRESLRADGSGRLLLRPVPADPAS